MDVILLLKYVADVEHIPPDAWDLDRGTLRRRRLRMVANPLDDRALRVGRAVAGNTGATSVPDGTGGSPGSPGATPDGRLIVLSMGPDAAERICRRSIAYGADEAVLLSDPAFSGADTLATARTLTAAVRRITADLALDRPLILAGMQSPDGDTAQVPAEVAALLGAPLIPYATGFELPEDPPEGDAHVLTVEAMSRRRRQRYRVDSGPIVITWTGLAPALPFATTLDGFRRAATAEVRTWSAADLGLTEEETGLAGSATQVKKIVSVPPSHSGGRVVTLAEHPDPPAAIGELAAFIAEHASQSGDGAPRGGDGARAAPPTGGGRSGDGAQPPAGTGHHPGDDPDIWVYMEVAEADGGEGSVSEQSIEGGSLELLGKARELAEELGVHATAVVCARGADPELSTILSTYGATRTIFLDAPARAATELTALTHHRDASLLAATVRLRSPRTVLIPATLLGRSVSALAAAELGAGLTADCTGLSLESPDAKPRHLLQTRPALGGNILATIVTKATGAAQPEMATVRSGVFPVVRFPRVEVRMEELTLPAPDAGVGGPTVRVRVEEQHTGAGRPGANPHGAAGQPGAATTPPYGAAPADDARGVDTNADVIVAVGLGIGSPERLDQYVVPLIERLRQALGVRVSLACSRAAVDAGILPYEYQIGQTGKSVRPALYIAVGISGAIQHRLGMEGAATIVSINPDPDAPIHRVSDFAVVAGVEESLPALTDALAGT